MLLTCTQSSAAVPPPIIVLLLRLLLPCCGVLFAFLRWGYSSRRASMIGVGSVTDGLAKFHCEAPLPERLEVNYSIY
jgi:hypothetical protein